MLRWPMARSTPKKKAPVRAFNLRGISEQTFFNIKIAAATERLSPRDWLLRLAEARLAELKQQGKLPKGP